MREKVVVPIALLSWCLGWAWSWFPNGDHPYFALLMLLSVAFAMPRNSKPQKNWLIKHARIICGALLGIGTVMTLGPNLDEIFIGLSRSVPFMTGATFYFLIRIFEVFLVTHPRQVGKVESSPGVTRYRL